MIFKQKLLVPFLGYRSFFSTPTLLKVGQEEAKFQINGSVVTRSQVQAIDPLKRTVAEWQLIVDWDLHRTHNFIIIDPLNPEELLYLNRKEYLAHQKICASNELQLILVAQPGSVRPVPISSDPTDTSQNSPWRGGKFESKWSRNFRSTWKTFLLLRHNVGKVVSRIEAEPKMVSETKDSIVRTVYAWASQLAHYAEVKNPGAVVWFFQPLATHLSKLVETKGQMAAITHLKVSLFALYSYLSGNPLRSTKPLGFGIRLRNGLPRVWPRELRVLIRDGNLQYIRIVASLLNSYRAMSAEHPAFDLSTIVKPHPNIKETPLYAEFTHFCKEVWPLLLEDKGSVPFQYKSGFGLIVSSAGANSSGAAMGGLVRDAHAWKLRPESERYVQQWFESHGDAAMTNVLKNAMAERHSSVNHGTNDKPRHLSVSFATNAMATRDAFSREGANPNWPIYSWDEFPMPVLGRLHSIDEAAGKVRVVAICDYFTQVACLPVHKHFFQILEKLPTDATFDQTGRTEAYFNKGLYPHWSYDLKSATDTIPTALYLEALTPLLKTASGTLDEARTRTQLWLSMLTDREWLTPDTLGLVRYGTGQPMGALSSWASMALVHHCLVQFAHYRATTKGIWFKDYLILGDDIDIARQPKVAEEYVNICNGFEIKIGLAKSMKSEKNFFEFANQRFCPEGNISPISLKEELSSTTWSSRLEFARRIISRFGTNNKDETSALLRKVATRSQWKVLVPELGSIRPSTYATLAKFCFLTPFGKGAKIEHIVMWLASVSPELVRKKLLHIVSSPDLRNLLLREFLRTLFYEILHRCKHRLGSAPVRNYVTNFSTESRIHFRETLDCEFCPLPHSALGEMENRGRTIKCDTLMDDSMRGNFGYDPDELPDGSPLTFLYLMRCINERNDKIRTKLSYLCYSVQEKYDSLDRIVWQSQVESEILGIQALLEWALGAWSDYLEIPAFIIPDMDKPMAKWPGMYVAGKMDKIPIAKRPDPTSEYKIRFEHDTIRAPMEALKLALMSQFGITVSEVPYIRTARGGNWSKSIRNASATFVAFNNQLWETMLRLDIAFAYAEALHRNVESDSDGALVIAS
nr:MAG: putative RNA-dependent RNA polymerase [Mitoviridae sp.]